MLGFDAISENPFSGLTAAVSTASHAGGAFLSKRERERIKKRTQAVMAEMERQWAEDAKERDELRGQLLDGLHPERIEQRRQERDRLQRELRELDEMDDDEADIEFLLLHS